MRLKLFIYLSLYFDDLLDWGRATILAILVPVPFARLDFAIPVFGIGDENVVIRDNYKVYLPGIRTTENEVEVGVRIPRVRKSLLKRFGTFHFASMKPRSTLCKSHEYINPFIMLCPLSTCDVGRCRYEPHP
jgi:hypothetical protein